jgi:hypothetical protein
VISLLLGAVIQCFGQHTSGYLIPDRPVEFEVRIHDSIMEWRESTSGGNDFVQSFIRPDFERVSPNGSYLLVGKLSVDDAVFRLNSAALCTTCPAQIVIVSAKGDRPRFLANAFCHRPE